MGFFDFLKKKPKCSDTCISIKTEVRHYEPRPEELAAWEREKAMLNAAHQRNIDQIRFTEIIPGNDRVSLSDIEIDFLGYLDGCKLYPLKIARIWSEHGLDFQSSIDKFFRGGLLSFAPVAYSLSKQKVSDLKIFLEAHNCPSCGNKQELVNRILAEIPSEIVGNRFPSESLKLTEKGENIVLRKKKRALNDRFKTASSNAAAHLQEGNLIAYRDDLMEIAEVDIAEERFHDALNALIMVFVLDASGAPTTALVNRTKEAIKDGFIKPGELLGYHPLIVPYPLRRIDKCVQKLRLTDQELETEFRSVVTESQIPMKFCSVDEFSHLFIAAVTGCDDADQIVAEYKARFIKRYAR